MKYTKLERELFRKLGSRGGKMRTKTMTPKQRSAAARKAVNARWSQAKTKSKAKAKTKAKAKAA